MVKDNEYYLIDQEWCSTYDVPVNYVLYFSIYYLFEWIKGFSSLISKKKLYEKYNLSSEEQDVYLKMSTYFFSVEFDATDRLTEQIIERQNEFKTFDNKIEILEEEKKALQETIDRIRKDNHDLICHGQDQEAIIIQKNIEIKRLNECCNDLSNDYNSIINSKSWKLTGFLRKLDSILKK